MNIADPCSGCCWSVLSRPHSHASDLERHLPRKTGPRKHRLHLNDLLVNFRVPVSSLIVSTSRRLKVLAPTLCLESRRLKLHD